MDKEDLFVFGYACKLFRDDQKAQQVDRGELLIPWMGDPSQHIDRYDARATIHNLKPYEPLPQPLEPEEYMSPEDKVVEDMCDDERYRSLGKEDDFVDHLKDEGKDGAAIGFTYDQAQQGPNQPEDPDQPTLKTLANVLEKTAEFIAQQGAQMEILMRAKEAANLKFQFLNPDNPYHSIYKQVLAKKRAKLQNPYLAHHYESQQLSVEDVEASLRNLTRNLPSAAPSVAQAEDSKPALTSNASNAYSKLVEKIRETKSKEGSNSNTPVPSPPPPEPPKVEPTPPPPEDEVMVEVPPMELQMLIDRTASYVCRHNLESGQQKGAEQLAVVKKLQKEKFGFLFPDHKYNTYYLFKVALYTHMLEKEHQANKKASINSSRSSSGAQSEKELQELAIRTFPTLKGFFNT